MFASLATRAGSDAGPSMIRAMRTIAANFGLLEPAINPQAGVAYILAKGDKTVTRTNAAAQTTTIPANATVPFDIGTKIDVIQTGAGALTIAAANGVTITHLRTLVAAGVGAVVRLIKTGTDTWVATGDLT